MMHHLEAGMKSRVQNIGIGAITGALRGGAGVQRWARVALQALQMLGQPPGDLGVVLAQMQTESGGNPLIVNKWDSNWAAGTPSVGLMQVIGPTFAEWAGPFRNVGPFEYGTSVNPLANIYAGLNYAIHRYGAAWTRVLGQGHGYAFGTASAVPGWALVGERGPELVRFRGGEQVRAGAGTTVYLTVQVGHGTHPVAAAQEIAKILNDGARSGVRLRRSILSANG
jgi:SLT domain-containing protein